jgi:hypothetical protein
MYSRISRSLEVCHAAWRCVSYCSCHGAILSATWHLQRILIRVPFLTQFSRPTLEAFRCSKQVRRYTVGKLDKSTFQKYKFYANRSSDEKFMAPGSRVVRAVFLHFSSEDSGQMGDATGEPRVAFCSWSCSLSHGSKLVDHLVVSWLESMHEGGCPGGKTHQIFNTFSLFLSVFACTVDVAPDVGF